MEETAMPLFNFRMDAETKRKLETLAKATERDMSGYLRWLIKREYDARYLPQTVSVGSYSEPAQA